MAASADEEGLASCTEETVRITDSPELDQASRDTLSLEVRPAIERITCDPSRAVS